MGIEWVQGQYITDPTPTSEHKPWPYFHLLYCQAGGLEEYESFGIVSDLEIGPSPQDPIYVDDASWLANPNNTIPWKSVYHTLGLAFGPNLVSASSIGGLSWLTAADPALTFCYVAYAYLKSSTDPWISVRKYSLPDMALLWSTDIQISAHFQREVGDPYAVWYTGVNDMWVDAGGNLLMVIGGIGNTTPIFDVGGDGWITVSSSGSVVGTLAPNISGTFDTDHLMSGCTVDLFGADPSIAGRIWYWESYNDNFGVQRSGYRYADLPTFASSGPSAQIPTNHQPAHQDVGRVLPNGDLLYSDGNNHEVHISGGSATDTVLFRTNVSAGFQYPAFFDDSGQVGYVPQATVANNQDNGSGITALRRLEYKDPPDNEEHLFITSYELLHKKGGYESALALSTHLAFGGKAPLVAGTWWGNGFGAPNQLRPVAGLKGTSTLHTSFPAQAGGSTYFQGTPDWNLGQYGLAKIDATQTVVAQGMAPAHNDLSGLRQGAIAIADQAYVLASYYDYDVNGNQIYDTFATAFDESLIPGAETLLSAKPTPACYAFDAFVDTGGRFWILWVDDSDSTGLGTLYWLQSYSLPGFAPGAALPINLGYVNQIYYDASAPRLLLTDFDQLYQVDLSTGAVASHWNLNNTKFEIQQLENELLGASISAYGVPPASLQSSSLMQGLGVGPDGAVYVAAYLRSWLIPMSGNFAIVRLDPVSLQPTQVLYPTGSSVQRTDRYSPTITQYGTPRVLSSNPGPAIGGWVAALDADGTLILGGLLRIDPATGAGLTTRLTYPTLPDVNSALDFLQVKTGVLGCPPHTQAKTGPVKISLRPGLASISMPTTVAQASPTADHCGPNPPSKVAVIAIPVLTQVRSNSRPAGSSR